MSYIISKPWGGSCGIGHQFHNWVVAWQLAYYYDLQFVHAPFLGTSISQGYNDYTDQRWEKFLNLGQDEIQESQLPNNIRRIKLPELPWKQNLWLQNTCDNKVWKRIIEEHKNNNVLFECVQNQFMRLDPICLRRHILRMRYWMARQKHPISCTFNKTKLNVAIHIRRGDITPNGSTKDRWVDLQIYINIINQIHSSLGDNVIFHIYSDGIKQNLKGLVNLPNVILHLREDVFNTFHHMILADVLIIGKSSFSALAGHLHNKIKIIQSWNSVPDIPHSLRGSMGVYSWEYPPANDFFVTMNNTGKLDINLLQTLLNQITGKTTC